MDVPRIIMHSAGETATMVADQTKYAGRSVADYVRMHPAQMALVAGCVTWWLLRGRDRSDDWDSVSEAAEAARCRTLEASERARVAAQSASVRAQDTWRRASTSVDDWVHEYPLAAGAIAVAVGAAIGLSVPSTEIENRALGEPRDLALEKARRAANQIKENVSQKVQNVAESVLDVTEATPTGSTTEPSQGRV